MAEIFVSALIARNSEGEFLTVRKHGTSMFMFPGGKPEAGESALDTIVREVREEISVDLRADQLQYLGQHAAAAANEAGFTVVGNVFKLLEPLAPAQIVLAAEIVELRWIDFAAAQDAADVAPLAKKLMRLVSATAA